MFLGMFEKTPRPEGLELELELGVFENDASGESQVIEEI